MITIDREKLAAAAEALGMDKEALAGSILGRMAKKFGGGYAGEAAKKAAPAAKGLLSRLKSMGVKLGLLGGAGAGLYHLGKSDAGGEAQPQQSMPMPPGGGGGSFSPQEQGQFARHGLDPDRLKFMQTLGRLRQGMNLENKLFQQALSGQLPANVMGGGEQEEDLESYA